MSCAVNAPNALATDIPGASSCLTAAHPPLTRQVLKYPACALASRDLASKLGDRQGRDEGPVGLKIGDPSACLFSPQEISTADKQEPVKRTDKTSVRLFLVALEGLPELFWKL